MDDDLLAAIQPDLWAKAVMKRELHELGVSGALEEQVAQRILAGFTRHDPPLFVVTEEQWRRGPDGEDDPQPGENPGDNG